FCHRSRSWGTKRWMRILRFMTPSHKVRHHDLKSSRNWSDEGVGVFAFGVVGGINFLLGAFGFTLLHAANRYSIVLMTIGLLVTAQMVGGVGKKYASAMLAAVILSVGLFDQLPTPITKAVMESNHAQAMEDKAIATALEKNLTAGSMVFQLPVRTFPESQQPSYEMGGYDLFRPWLWTKDIHFSYGTMMGRGDADWQVQVASKAVDQMVFDLDRFGFSALLINRDAYPDRANELADSIESLGYARFIDKPDYFGFRLRPVDKPEQIPFAGYRNLRRIINMSVTTPHIVGRFDAKHSEMVAKEGEQGVLVFGPYISLFPGKYRVSFFLTANGNGKEPVASVNVASTAEGKMNLVTSIDVNPSTKEQSIKLIFEAKSKFVYEFRILTKGNAQVAGREIVLEPM
ncbi:MAG: hypothetical protein PHE55_15970, partial [Methylococcaceae bacterium]|nr:hypothetical protein [Methylococcaceae bacterium]